MTIKCATCRADVDDLAVFPGGLCLECFAKTPRGRAMWAADDIVAAFGGRTLRKR